MSVILQPGDGSQVDVPGYEIRSKIVSEDTNGTLWIAEFAIAASYAGPPPHIHYHMFEVFYVLEGVVRCHMAGGSNDLTAGGFALVSPGTLHTYSNPGNIAAKFLLVCSPGGLEGYFKELSAAIERDGFPAPPPVIKALGDTYDNIVPPALP
jgi:mannose-6-phosphate isomerase-like protein (cupin superfamily)